MDNGHLRALLRYLSAATLLAVALPAATQETALPIPPLLELGDRGSVNAGTLVAEEHDGLAYNGSSPGPTLVVDRGESYEVTVRNELSELTTVHWHGLNIAADADGGPRRPIAPGDAWIARFTIDQPAGTGWYHPHAMGTTAKQVALGLAGMIIVRDGETRLPSTYGVDDLPIVIADPRLDRNGRRTYRPARADIMHGFAGNTLLTNGAVEPVAAVPKGWVRLRILNGGNAAYLAIRFPSSLQARVVATEGGFLRDPLPVGELVMAAAERYEIIVNTAALGEDEIVWIEAVTDSGLEAKVLGLRSNGRLGVTEVPSRLPAPPPIVTGGGIEDLPRRRFVLETAGMMSRTPFTINGRGMDMNRIDERIELGTTEVWEIVNAGPMRMTHSFHLHGTHFQILSVNGAPPPPLLTGLADTVLVPPGSTVEIAVRFENAKGVFMYHCHMLEHEEAGMMGQVEVY